MKFTINITIDYHDNSGFVLKIGDRVITRSNDEKALVPVLELCGLSHDQISTLLLEALVTMPVKLKADGRRGEDGHEKHD